MTISIKDVQTRMRDIMKIECPKELHRLREHFAMNSDLSPAEVGKALIAAVNLPVETKPQGNRPSYIPEITKIDGKLSPAEQGRADALAFTKAGMLRPPEPTCSVGGAADGIMRN